MSRTPATASSTGSRPSTHTSFLRRRPRPTVGVVITIATLIALGLRLYQLSRPGYLFGVTEYDDGTDFGSAVRLVDGFLPYRDFIMVQPPGITVLMAPVALATKGMGTVIGMAAGRVLTTLAGAAAVPLVGLLVRHRGLLAAIVACGTVAVYPDSIAAAKTVLLEPWLVLLCLLGALAIFDRDDVAVRRWRVVWGGAAFGAAGAVKVWAILPVAVILVLTARRPRRALAFAGGVAAGFFVIVLPFALTAPATFIRSVIVAQLIRTDVVRIPFGFRLQSMLGLTHAPAMPTVAAAVIGGAVVAVVALVTVAGSRLARRSPPPLDRFALATTAVVVAAFLWPPDFYYHYPAFLAPFLGLAFALPSSRFVEALRSEDARWRGARMLRRSAIGVATITLLALAVLQGVAESRLASAVTARELSTVQRLIPAGSCVLTDQVSYTVAIDRFVSDAPGCSVMVDGIGSDYALSGGFNAQNGAGKSPAVRRMWLSAFQSAGYVWLTGQASLRIPWTPRLLNYFTAHFTPLVQGPTWLYVRRTSSRAEVRVAPAARAGCGPACSVQP